MRIKFFEDFFNRDFSFLGLNKIYEVCTDSRSVKKNSIFIALKGLNFDGNSFAQKALDEGAALAVVSDPSLKGENFICVEDTEKTLQALGRAWQKHIKPQVIGITGSNGKTTTKFFTAQLLENFFKTKFAPKSFNNSIGVPITQLLLREGDEVLVSEMGTNSIGEIAFLTKLVDPDFAVVTTVGESHLEGFGSLSKIAEEKEEIYKASALKTRVFNLDNEWTKTFCNKYRETKSISFSSLDKSADVYMTAEQKALGSLLVKGVVQGFKFEKELKLFGDYNVYNVMAAVSFGLALNLKPEEIVEKLIDFKTPWGRSQILELGQHGALFDGYNSNLQSMRALFGALSKLNFEKPLNLVLGEMLEVGTAREALHEDLGFEAASLNPDRLYFLGESAAGFLRGVQRAKYQGEVKAFKTYDEALIAKALKTSKPSYFVFKASRGTRIERLAEIVKTQ